MGWVNFRIQKEVFLGQCDLSSVPRHRDQRKALLNGPRVHHVGHAEGLFTHLRTT